MTAKCGIRPFSVGIDGVYITVKCKTGGVAVVAEPDDDGYIFGLEEVEEVTIIIEIDPGINVFGFNVDGNKDITPAKNYSQAARVSGKIYRKKVPIHIPIHKGKEPYTQYNENHIKLLEIGTGGYFAVWEAAIVFQNGLGFLTIQMVYEEFVYQGDGGLSCPEFNKRWPQLVKFIEDICKGHGFSYHEFSSLDEYAPDLKVSMDTHDDDIGMVKCYNVAQGFGAISTNKGDAFVHYKDVDSEERLVLLDAGDYVLFEKLIPNTYKNDGFAYKAVGVLAPEA